MFILTDDNYPYVNEFISSVSKHQSEIVIDKCKLEIKIDLEYYYDK